jgi:hypothetical protein
MKIASTARQLPGRKTKDEEYGRNEAFSNRRSSYTFDLPLADEAFRSLLTCLFDYFHEYLFMKTPGDSFLSWTIFGEPFTFI